MSSDRRPIDVVRKFDDPDFNDLPPDAQTHQNRHPKAPPVGSTAEEADRVPNGVIEPQAKTTYESITPKELDKMPNS